MTFGDYFVFALPMLGFVGIHSGLLPSPVRPMAIENQYLFTQQEALERAADEPDELPPSPRVTPVDLYPRWAS
jgi:hypothetical protein